MLRRNLVSLSKVQMSMIKSQNIQIFGLAFDMGCNLRDRKTKKKTFLIIFNDLAFKQVLFIIFLFFFRSF